MKSIGTALNEKHCLLPIYYSCSNQKPLYIQLIGYKGGIVLDKSCMGYGEMKS